MEDWQRNHQERERRLVEANQLQETKFAELNRREAELSMDEGRIQVAKNELQVCLFVCMFVMMNMMVALTTVGCDEMR